MELKLTDFVQAQNAKDGCWERLDRGEYNDYWVEDKYDGERWSAWHTPDGDVIVYSRHISSETGLNVIKTDNVPHLVEVLKKTPRDTIVDGEMVFIKDGRISFQGIRQIMGCKISGKAVERQKQRGWLTYVLFDLIRFGGQDLTNEDNATRRAGLETLYYRLKHNDVCGRMPEFEYLQIAERYSIDQAIERFAEVVAEGGEGLMLKNPLAVYRPGDRPSRTWLKLKRTDTFDAVIMGFEAPSQWYAEPGTTGPDKQLYPEGRLTKFHQNGWIGAIIYGQYKEVECKGCVGDSCGWCSGAGVVRELVRMGRSSGINDDIRKRMSEQPEAFIGRVAEFTCMGRNKNGASRHPAFKRMRDDKNPEDCIFESKALYESWS